jgi:triosephosphate isomerase
MPSIKTLKDIDLKNKRALVRVNFDVPLDKNGNIEDDFRIRESLPTIKYLIKNKCRIILISHLGRPEGKKLKKYSLRPTAKRLGELLKKEIVFLGKTSGKQAEKISETIQPGDILMLENLRFDAREEKNSAEFAQELSKLGSIFINEAFPVCHREHASIVGIPNYLPSAAGFCLEKEIRELNRILFHPQKPLIAIIGGAKISTKIKIINKFLYIADRVLIGGALANTIFAKQGFDMADSTIDKESFSDVDKINLKNPKLFLPIDLGIWDGERAHYREVGNLKKGEKALDIGLKTIDLFISLIKGAKTIIWNGPLGLTTQKPFDRGSAEATGAIHHSGAYSIVGGGDTIAFINEIKKEKVFSYLSTGGGAMLDYLAKETLPGIEALEQ